MFDNDRFEDEVIYGDETVRSFMATAGRTQTSGTVELALEAMVSVTPAGRAKEHELQFERRAIVTSLHGTCSVAELAVHIGLPLRAGVVLASEMVDEGLLEADEVVDVVDLSTLSKLRRAIAAL